MNWLLLLQTCGPGPELGAGGECPTGIDVAAFQNGSGEGGIWFLAPLVGLALAELVCVLVSRARRRKDSER